MSHQRSDTHPEDKKSKGAAPAAETLSDNGAKTLQQTRREVAEATAQEEEKTKVRR